MTRERILKAAKIPAILVVLFLIAGWSMGGLRVSGNGDADEGEYVRFTIEYRNRVYDGDSDIWNFTVANIDLPADSNGQTLFYFRIYLDGDLLWDEFNDTVYGTWQLSKGTTATKNYAFSAWKGPSRHKVRIELYWYKDGTPKLLARRTRVVHVAKVFISGWTPSAQIVHRGTGQRSNLSISFSNGGNDHMYNTSIAVRDADGLEITPQFQTLGLIPAEDNRTTVFSVVAPATKEAARTHTPRFELTYSDFRGVTHTETYAATIEAMANPVAQNLLILLGGVGIASALTGMVAFLALARRKRKKRNLVSQMVE